MKAICLHYNHLMYVDSTSELSPNEIQGRKRNIWMFQCSKSTLSHIRYFNYSCYFLRARFLLSVLPTLFFFKRTNLNISLTLFHVKMYIYMISGASLFSGLLWIIKFQGYLNVPVLNRGASTNQILHWKLCSR